MNEPEYVYVTYIASTPEKIWDALVKADVTRQYWRHENVSDWKPGSEWRHVRDDAAKTVDLIGEVVEFDRPRRMVLTWADPANAADKAKHSRATFDIEPFEGMTRLTVTHDNFAEGSNTRRLISNGWPRVLSSLKSYLETGRALDLWAQPKAA
jgi:uncharacterized protein YndB with AHSA1/START domain